MIDTQDPESTALRLIRRAAMAGKPVMFWLGPIRNTHRQLIATRDEEDLVKGLARETIMVSADMRADTLASALTAIWTRLSTQMPAGRPK